MQIEHHLAASRRFLDDAVALESESSHMGAAEMIWGATVQALEAIGHISAGNVRAHLSSNGRRRLAASIVNDGLAKYYRAQNDLHGHFYKGNLEPQSRAESMRQGHDYVAELLNIALSSAPDLV